MRRLFPAALLAVTLALFGFALLAGYRKIGSPWGDAATFSAETSALFTLQDYFLAVVPSAVSGLLFFLMGLLLWAFLAARPGVTPLLVFHFLFGNFLILLPEFVLGIRGIRPVFASVALLLIPAGIYFAWKFRPSGDKIRTFTAGIGLGIALPLALGWWLYTSRSPLPPSVVAPLALLFPVSLFLGVLFAELRQSRWQLVQTEKMATMGSLLAGLAHEINNPLTFIYSNLEPLRDTVGELKALLPDPEGKGESKFEEISATVDTMEEGATRAKEIVENLRHFSYPGRREKESVDLNTLLTHSIALLAPKWKGRLRIIPRFGEIPQIQAWAGDLGQVFLNVLANACEATPKRGAIRVRTWREGDTALVAVRDSGTGIPKETLARIFDPFFTTKAQGEGTGLGLAIALQIVQKHQGRIDVKSEPGKGAEVRIALPMAAVPTAREIEDEAEAALSARKEV